MTQYIALDKQKILHSETCAERIKRTYWVQSFYETFSALIRARNLAIPIFASIMLRFGAKIVRSYKHNIPLRVYHLWVELDSVWFIGSNALQLIGFIPCFLSFSVIVIFVMNSWHCVTKCQHIYCTNKSVNIQNQCAVQIKTAKLRKLSHGIQMKCLHYYLCLFSVRSFVCLFICLFLHY